MVARVVLRPIGQLGEGVLGRVDTQIDSGVGDDGVCRLDREVLGGSA